MSSSIISTMHLSMLFATFYFCTLITRLSTASLSLSYKDHSETNEFLFKHLAKYFDKPSNENENESNELSTVFVETFIDSYKIEDQLCPFKNLGNFKNVPDTVSHLILSYLDIYSFTSFFQTDKYFNRLGKMYVLKRLSHSGAGIVFRDLQINFYMQDFIAKHFPGITDPNFNIHDSLLAASFKFLQEETGSDTLESLQISYLFEIVFGMDELAPSSMNMWRSFYIQNLLNYDLPICKDFYMVSINQRLISDGFHPELIKSFIENVEYVIKLFDNYRKRIKNAERAIIYLYHEYSDSRFFLIFSEIYYVIIFKILNPQDVGLDGFDELNRAAENFFFSGSFLESCSLKYILTLKNIKWNKIIYKNAKEIIEKDPIKYIRTRDYKNVFNVDYFLNDCQGDIKLAISEMILSPSPRMIHFNILKKLIRTGIYNFQAAQNKDTSIIYTIFNSFKHELNSICYKIIVNEVSTSLNMFYMANLWGSIQFCHVFSSISFSLEIIKFYIQSLKTDDPLPLLFLYVYNDQTQLRLLKPLIAEKKLNIHKQYIFDGDMTTLYLERIGNINTATLNGQTMTFEQIVLFLLPNRPEFIQLFYDEIGIEVEIEIVKTKQSLTPISFFKFVHQGILEPSDV